MDECEPRCGEAVEALHHIVLGVNWEVAEAWWELYFFVRQLAAVQSKRPGIAANRVASSGRGQGRHQVGKKNLVRLVPEGFQVLVVDEDRAVLLQHDHPLTASGRLDCDWPLTGVPQSLSLLA